MKQDARIKVIIVDDSALIRKMYAHMLEGLPDIEVVAVANDPYDAREKIKQLNPDVITLDVEMPRMDGISFLEKIMSLRPMPVIMASSLTRKGADITLRALEIGAVDYITKPMHQTENTLLALKGELVEKIRHASKARPRAATLQRKQATSSGEIAYSGRTDDRVIAIGASTGGVEALNSFIPALPTNIPPIVITQHMPPVFTESFARRLDVTSNIRVSEARNGDMLEPSHAYIAPGDYHMRIRRKGKGWQIITDQEARVQGHRPSVDVLFHSVAEEAGAHAVGVILTGMGRDGAEGLKAMRTAGAITLGQNEASCVVYGMPKVAFEQGAVERELPLMDLPKAMLTACRNLTG